MIVVLFNLFISPLIYDRLTYDNKRLKCHLNRSIRLVTYRWYQYKSKYSLRAGQATISQPSSHLFPSPPLLQYFYWCTVLSGWINTLSCQLALSSLQNHCHACGNVTSHCRIWNGSVLNVLYIYLCVNIFSLSLSPLFVHFVEFFMRKLVMA